MKKLIISTIALALLLCVGQVYGAGSVTQTYADITRTTAANTSPISLLTFSWTADAADGSVPATASTRTLYGYVILAITDPGSPAPTAAYDITITDPDGVDVMGGQLADRSATASEHAVPQLQSGVYGGRWIYGTVTLNVTNNSVNSAKGVVKIYIQR